MKLADARGGTPQLSLSVVSHGQGQIVRHLLADLRQLTDTSFEILLTINIPEDLGFLAAFTDLPLRVLHSPTARGFGANHNAAFAASRGCYFAVVNPDIRAPRLALQPMLQLLQDPQVGVCAPEVLSSAGAREDSVRRFPNLAGLLGRVLLRRRAPDYHWQRQSISVDWAAGMFLLFSRTTFAGLQGFDERYHMYMEDVDICRRLHRLGRRVVLQPAVQVVHDAQRASRRDPKHLAWHLRSTLRYLTGL